MLKQIFWYETVEGKRPFGEWLLSLKDKNVRHRITIRLDRLIYGNFGDARQVGAGVSELRFHFGPGYRVYFGLDGEKIILLLSGGDKSSQGRDIQRAQQYWMDYLRRNYESGR